MMQNKMIITLLFYCLLTLCLASCIITPQNNMGTNDSGDGNKETADHNNCNGEESTAETNDNQKTVSNVDSQPYDNHSKKLDYNHKWEPFALPLTKPDPSENDILDRYYQASYIEEMFESTYLNFTDDSSVDIDGDRYFKVIDDRYGSIADLERFLKTVFSDDMAKILINNGRYYEADGELYTLCADRGGNITVGESTYEIIRESATKIIFHITTETLDAESQLFEVIGYKTHDMILEYLNEEWLFTQFYNFGYYDSFDEFVQINL